MLVLWATIMFIRVSNFITKDFKLIRATPAIKMFGNERHLAVNKAEKMEKEIDSLNIPASTPAVLVSDAAANMASMRTMLTNKGVIRDSLNCANHKVQRAVKEVMDKPELKAITSKAKRVVKHFR